MTQDKLGWTADPAGRGQLHSTVGVNTPGGGTYSQLLVGRVIDAADESPIAGAAVAVRDEETLREIDGPILSDAEGRFSFAGVRNRTAKR